MVQQFQDFLSQMNVEKLNVENNKENNTTTIDFQYEGLSYLFVYDNDDTNYFRLMLPNITQIDDVNRDKVLNAINYINYKLKVVKAIIIDDVSVWLSAEQFTPTSKVNMDTIFYRFLVLLKIAIEEYRSKLKD